MNRINPYRSYVSEKQASIADTIVVALAVIIIAAISFGWLQ